MYKTLFLILYIAASLALLPAIARAGITGPTVPQYVPVKHFTPLAAQAGMGHLKPDSSSRAAADRGQLTIPVIVATKFFDRSPAVVLRKVPQVRVMFTQELATLLRILGRAVQVIGILCGLTLLLSKAGYSNEKTLARKMLRVTLAVTTIGICIIAPVIFSYMGVQALGIDPFRL